VMEMRFGLNGHQARNLEEVGRAVRRNPRAKSARSRTTR
jgi:hypothetical protein